MKRVGVFSARQSVISWLSLIILIGLPVFRASATVTNTPAELSTNHQWVVQNILTSTNTPPFSFNFNSVNSASSNLFSGWKRLPAATNSIDANRTQYTIQWTNSSNKLQVKLVAMEYLDFPVVDWTVFLTNAGTTSTSMLTNIQAFDVSLTRGVSDPEFVLNTIRGDDTSSSSYAPQTYTLSASSTTAFSPPSNSGKSTDGATGWPYYNLQVPGGGNIITIGWPGQWASSFKRDASQGLRILAGQQLTHLVLNSHEMIRTPLITRMYWQGSDVVRAQNLWRHFYLAHVIPRPSGQAPTILQTIPADASGSTTMQYVNQGIKVDAAWLDAGSTTNSTWYPSGTWAGSPYTGGSAWINTGTWDWDTNNFPNKVDPMIAINQPLGIKFVMWFEPERVGNTNNSFLATNNTSWLLPATATTVGRILNEGNTNAFNWLTNHFSTFIKSNHVDWYREDMNGNGPLPAWQANDASNRQGITENFYVQGHLAYWDALTNFSPMLRIDSCASGGKRNDLEEMRRAVPLTRSDFNQVGTTGVIEGNQAQTYGLSYWLPFQGQGWGGNDMYSIRSFYLPGFQLQGFGGGNAAAQGQGYAECRKIAPIMLFGDYYPLTPYSVSASDWIAWQFDRPDTGEGCVQAFRHSSSTLSSMVLSLQGLSPTNYYSVQDFDRGDLGWHTGAELMIGISVQIPNASQAAVLYYTNAQGVLLSATGTPVVGSPTLTTLFTASGTAASTLPVLYSWDFGDGIGTSTLQNPSYSYGKPGRYVARVTATDGAGNTNSMQIPITVTGSGWHKMKISFPGYTRSEVLTNFPALVSFSSSMGNGFAYSQMASTNASDLFFMSSDETQPLPFEIQNWNTNGNSYVWVQVPLLTNNASIWAYWGDTNLASPISPLSTNRAAWANGYAGVWHLSTNGAALSVADSTTNAYNGSNSGVVPTNGLLNGSAFFNAGVTSRVDVGTSANSLVNQKTTISLWVYPPGSGGTYLVTKGSDNTAQSYGLLTVNSDLYFLTFADSPSYLSIASSVPANTWTYISGVIDGNNKYLYVNGILKTNGTFTGALAASANSLWFGGQNRPGFTDSFSGAMEEVRLSSLARSSNWVWAEFQTLASNALFSSYATITNIAGPTVPNAPSTLIATPLSANQINLSWKDNALNEANYVIQRSLTGSNNWVTLAVAPPNTTSFSDNSGLAGNTLYYYQVAATNAVGISSWATANATTLVAGTNGFKLPISFSGYNRSETLTNFPLLVVLNTNLNGFSYNQFVSPSGLDLRFIASDGVTELPYEIEKWDTNGNSYVWVQVPLLNASASFNATWGNTLNNVQQPYTTNGAVWASDYVGVWHLTNGVTLSGIDSSSNHWNGTVGSGPQATNGLVDGGGLFKGTFNDYVDAGTNNALPNGTGTISIWINLNTNAYGLNNYAFAKGDDNGVSSWGLDLGPGPTGCNVSLLYGAAQFVQAFIPGNPETNSWHMVSAVMKPNAQQIYFDGALLATSNLTTITPLSTNRINIGKTQRAAPFYYAFNGVLDEARIATAQHSSNWMWAEFMNIASNTTLSSYGTVSANGFQAPVALANYTPSETLTNFPLLVVLGTNVNGFSYNQFASPQGWDLRFTSSDGVTELPYELEKWNTNGNSYAWVLIPVMNSNASFYVNWGNAANTAQKSYTTNGTVWTNSFIGVWHLPDGSTLSAKDSTTNARNGTITGAVAANGVVDGAGSFDGNTTTLVTIGNMGALPPQGTIGFWMSPALLENWRNPLTTKYSATPNNAGFRWEADASGSFAVITGDDAGNLNGYSYGSSLVTNSWYWVQFAWNTNSSNAQGFFNGVSVFNSSDNRWPTTMPDVRFGTGFSTARNWRGSLDEIRFSNIARSSNWLWAEYMTMASNTVLSTYGTATESAVPFSINTADASLRLWLRADTLAGTTVPLWTDSSTNHTAFAVPLIGEAATDPSGHTPLLVSVTNNGVIFQAVRFRQTNDPVTAPHTADRLWQTNNFGVNDPTAIPASSDLTMVMVYKNNHPDTTIPSQTIFGKRGPSDCPWSFNCADSSHPTEHFFVDYAGSVTYFTGLSNVAPEWGIVEMTLTAGGTLTTREYYESLGGWRQSVQTGVSRSGGGTNAINTGFYSTAGTPVCLAFHAQGIGGTTSNPFGNGTYERFDGYISEILLYSRTMGSNELANVESYLTGKYKLSSVRGLLRSGPSLPPSTEFIAPLILSVNADGTNIVISWPINGSDNAMLQESSDFIHWTNCEVTVVPLGTNNTVTIAPNDSKEFYRLIR